MILNNILDAVYLRIATIYKYAMNTDSPLGQNWFISNNYNTIILN